MKKIIKNFKAEILYLLFGGLTTVINVLSYYLFYNFLKCSNVLSTIVAWVISVLFAFVTNRIFVFESKEKGIKNILREISSFFTFRFLTGVMDLLIMWLTVDIMHWNGMFWKIVSNILVVILNYFASKIFVFKK